MRRSATELGQEIAEAVPDAWTELPALEGTSKYRLRALVRVGGACTHARRCWPALVSHTAAACVWHGAPVFQVDSHPAFSRIKKPPSDCWIRLHPKELLGGPGGGAPGAAGGAVVRGR